MVNIGIDMGASSIKIAVMKDNKIIQTWIKNHYGLLKETLFSAFSSLDLDEKFNCLVTGSNAKLLSNQLGIKALGEIPSIVEGVKYLVPNSKSIIEIGSQSSLFITNIKDKAPRFSVNEHCAGGTGSFFEDQMSRLGLTIDQYSEVCNKATYIPRLSGRCSVFAKTDIIHRQQEGALVPDILSGLCYAMIRNYKAVIVKDLLVEKPVVFCGGVTQNQGVIKAIKDVFSLSDEELIIPELANYACCIGSALKACETVTKENLIKAIMNIKHIGQEKSSLSSLKNEENVRCPFIKGSNIIPNDGCILGIDIGSTSTDLVLIDREGKLIHHQYLRTSGDPENAVRKGLENIEKSFGSIKYISTGITGSGRQRLGKLMNVDIIKDEITSQARCASFLNPLTDTVFEIGGQDSKYISLEDSQVSDFQMNKICAAGTGSFIEEQASRMNIPLKDFGEMALSSENPTNLGERCTVFIETSITSALASDTPMNDIAAGLCHSIVQNYLHKVVGNKKVGNHIVLQGGVAYNPGIVAAFKSVYKDRITVSPYFPISGAYGVALLAMEKCKDKVSSFRGLDFTEKEEKECVRENKCSAFFEKSRKLLFEGYDGSIDPSKKTVGIPFALMIHKLFPMANEFFKNLGYNVLLTKPTNEETIRLSQEYAQGETCYPIKLIYGHMQQLVEAKVDYIFIPSVRTMKHEISKVKNNYGCVYMQTAPASIAKCLHIEEKGITLLNPVFDLDFGKKAMVSAMLDLGKILRKPKPLCFKALIPGAMAVRKHTIAMEEQGKKMLASLNQNDKVLVLITRNYGLSDPVLNMGIPNILMEKGYKILTLSHLPAHDIDISKEYPNLYWPFGQHIISGIKIVAHHPNLYAVCLNNHGCGPDTMLSQIIKTEMKNKPYLQIEVDEHFSKVGVITRIEAFLNSLEHQNTVKLSENFDIKDVDIKTTDICYSINKEKPLFILPIGNYTPFIRKYFSILGIQTKLLRSNSVTNLDKGRAETNSKEYLPFTFILDSVLSSVSQEDMTILLPETEGAEADGLYTTAIRSVLNRKGFQNIHISAFLLETLYEKCNDLDLFMRSLVMGDLSYITEDKSDDILSIFSWDEIEELAKSYVPYKEFTKTLGITGTPLSLTVLDDSILETLENEGYRIIRSSLAEYLIFMWFDRAIEEKNNSLKKQLMVYVEHLEKLSNILGKSSPFADSFKTLFKIADKSLPRFAGGNGRYRWAKTISMSDIYDGVLTLSPRYENTSTIMEMKGLSTMCKCPVFHADLDGDWDESSWSRLRSFLYYC